MVNLIRNNWRGILFPTICGGIILSDQVLFDLPWAITLVKIFVFSILHILFVLKSKYVYNSDIYNYVTLLNIELDKNHVIKPFLTRGQASLIWWGFFFLLNLYLLRLTIIVQNLVYVHGLLVILGSIIFIDSLNEIFRTLTNKADLARVHVPYSLQQTRGVIQISTKLIPTCVNMGKVTMAVLGGTELGYPLIFGDGQKLGPVTSGVANQIYSDCNIPIETRNDLNYESYKVAWNNEIEKYQLNDTLLPERHRHIRCNQHFLDLGLRKDQIEALKTPGLTPTSGKK